MRLLMISGDRSLAAGRRGPFAAMLEEFARHWERIDVICPEAKDRRKKTEDLRLTSTVFVHPSPWSLLWQSRWIAQEGKELIREHHHDVMTVQDYPPFYNSRGAQRLSQKTGVPSVLEIHHIVGDPIPGSTTERIGKILSKLYFPRAARHVSAIRTVNANVRNQLASWGIALSKIHIVPSFYLDHELIKGIQEAAKQYDLAFCGRLVANKGLMEVLQAVQQLSDASLLIIGDGPVRNEAESFIRRHNISNRVKMVGWLDGSSDVLTAMKSAKVFIMNSKSEGGPRVALEAMALGLPVIATRVGVIPEVIRQGENGLFTTGTSEDLASKIQHLLADQALRDHMGREATKILERFEKKKLIGEYAEFVKNAARTSSPSHP